MVHISLWFILIKLIYWVWKHTIHTIKKNTYDLVVASKEIELEANVDKTKYMVMSRGQNAGRNHNLKIDNTSFERVE